MCDLTVGYRSKDAGPVVALEGVTFELSTGEAVGLLGESGCGKTTLGLALLGLLPPAGRVMRGSAMFQGQNLLTLEEGKLQGIRGARISMVQQEPGAALNPVLRIGEQITEVIRAHRPFSRERAREEAGFLLAQVGLRPETSIASAYPHQVSGGQQQRVAIAQAIACRPALVIADEPTTALDKVTQLEILDLLTSLRQKLRLSLLLITHDSGVLVRAVDRILVIRDGRITQQGPTSAVISESVDAYTQALLQAPRLKNHRSMLARNKEQGREPTVRGVPSHLDESDCCHQAGLAETASIGMTGAGHPRSELLTTRIAAQTGESEPLLRAVNLEKRYVQGRWLSSCRHVVEALRQVELKLGRGSTLALIGASGSGKSTLARCLAGLEKPDHGEIWFEHTNLAALTERELTPFRRQIQLIFQDPGSSLNPRFTAVDIVSEPLLAVRGGTKEQCHDRALALMEQVGLPSRWGERLPHQFSSGQRRRLAIARALSLEPKILILDEALAGLDRPMQAQIADLLLRLQAALSLTYLYISHDLGWVGNLADQVAVLHQGKIVESVKTAELFARPQSVQASSLVSAALELSGVGG